MARTKTIAVSEAVWERLKEIMKRENARNFNDVLKKLLVSGRGVPKSRFGVHKASKLRFSQEEHEEITKDLH